LNCYQAIKHALEIGFLEMLERLERLAGWKGLKTTRLVSRLEC